MFTSILNYFRRPVIFVTLANDKADGLNLREEEKGIVEALKPVKRRVKLDYIRETTYDDVFQGFGIHNSRIHIYHFAGHSNDSSVIFEDKPGKLKFLFERIGKEKDRNVKLVFLNGCSNKKQLQDFFEAGIDAIIATHADIHDVDAINLSRHFYIALAEGATIEEAFNTAKIYINGQSQREVARRQLRDIPDFPEEEKTYKNLEAIPDGKRRGFKVKKVTFPWGLYPNPNSNVNLDWKFPPPSWQRQLFVLLPLIFSIGLGWFQIENKAKVTLCLEDPISGIEIILQKKADSTLVVGITNTDGCVELEYQDSWELGDMMEVLWDHDSYESKDLQLKETKIYLK